MVFRWSYSPIFHGKCILLLLPDLPWQMYPGLEIGFFWYFQELLARCSCAGLPPPQRRLLLHFALLLRQHSRKLPDVVIHLSEKRYQLRIRLLAGRDRLAMKFLRETASTSTWCPLHIQFRGDKMSILFKNLSKTSNPLVSSTGPLVSSVRTSTVCWTIRDVCEFRKYGSICLLIILHEFVSSLSVDEFGSRKDGESPKNKYLAPRGQKWSLLMCGKSESSYPSSGYLEPSFGTVERSRKKTDTARENLSPPINICPKTENSCRQKNLSSVDFYPRRTCDSSPDRSSTPPENESTNPHPNFSASALWIKQRQKSSKRQHTTPRDLRSSSNAHSSVFLCLGLLAMRKCARYSTGLLGRS